MFVSTPLLGRSHNSYQVQTEILGENEYFMNLEKTEELKQSKTTKVIGIRLDTVKVQFKKTSVQLDFSSEALLRNLQKQ